MQSLAQVYDPRRKPLPALEHLDTWTRNAFYARRYPDDQIRAEEIERCVRVVCDYASQDEDAEATLAVEAEGSFIISHEGKPLFNLYARLDRILVRHESPDTLVVRDYKCAQHNVNLFEAYVVLRVAKLLYPSYEKHVLELDWIDRDGRVERDTIQGCMLKGIDPLVKARALEVFGDGEFRAEPGEGCHRCPLRSECQPNTKVVALEDLAQIA
jgi:hypothetical protein